MVKEATLDGGLGTTVLCITFEICFLSENLYDSTYHVYYKTTFLFIGEKSRYICIILSSIKTMLTHTHTHTHTRCWWLYSTSDVQPSPP